MLSSVVMGRLTSRLDMADVGRVEDGEVENVDDGEIEGDIEKDGDDVDDPDVDAVPPSFVYVEDPITTVFGQVREAISKAVAEG